MPHFTQRKITGGRASCRASVTSSFSVCLAGYRCVSGTVCLIVLAPIRARSHMPSKIVDLSARSTIIHDEPFHVHFWECTPKEFLEFLIQPRKFLADMGIELPKECRIETTIENHDWIGEHAGRFASDNGTIICNVGGGNIARGLQSGQLWARARKYWEVLEDAASLARRAGGEPQEIMKPLRARKLYTLIRSTRCRFPGPRTSIPHSTGRRKRTSPYFLISARLRCEGDAPGWMPRFIPTSK